MYYSSYQTVGSAVAMLVGLLLAIGGTIALMAAFLPAKNRDRFTGFAGWLYNFCNFRSMWYSTIIRVLWLFATLFLLGTAVTMLFVNPLVSLLMLLAIVVVRLVYESFYLLFGIFGELRTTNDYLRRLVGDTAPVEKIDLTPEAPKAAPAPAAPAAAVCKNCGAALQADAAFCHECGTKAE